MDIRHPSNPVWSHDSRKVAFLWERAGVTDIYVVPADGSVKPVAITKGGTGSAGLLWSADNQWLYVIQGGQMMQLSADGSGQSKPAGFPRGAVLSRDGKSIAYVSGGSAGGVGGRGGRRGGGAVADATAPPATAPAGPSEILIGKADGGGADRVFDRVTTFDGPVNGLAWTPDGQRLTFTSGGTGGGQPIYHDDTPTYSGAKIIYRATENAGGGTPADNFIVPARGGTPVKYETGAGGRGGGRGGNRWVDATHLLLDRTSPDFKRRSIFVVDTTTGNQTLVQEDVKEKFWSVTGGAQAGSQASPDGRWISFLSDKDGWDQLYVMSGKSAAGSAVQVTKGAFETWRPSWSPESTRLAFDSNEGPNPGSRHLGVVTLNGDPSRASVRMVTSGRGADVQAVWSPDGTKLVYQHSDPWNSADLYTIDVTGSAAKPVRLTDSMPSSIDKSLLTEPQLVHYPGPDGKPVPAYLFMPKNLNRTVKHPAIVWIHGDGINQNYDGWHIERNYAVYYSIHQYFLQQGYVVIAPDYRGSIGYGSAWREGVYMDVGGKDFRDAGLASSYLKTLSYVDGNRVGVWGLSYGGFFTLLCVTEMPTAYRAAVDVAGVVDYAMYYTDPYHGTWTTSRIGTPEEHPDVYAQASPVSHVDRLVTPLLVLHGTADVNVPYVESVRLIDELVKKGKGDLVTFMMYPGEFHYFTREHVLRDAWHRVELFWDKHLKGH
jgi:dipeptidyl aminopeptidase/acylaminoacyl peptidase